MVTLSCHLHTLWSKAIIGFQPLELLDGGKSSRLNLQWNLIRIASMAGAALGVRFRSFFDDEDDEEECAEEMEEADSVEAAEQQSQYTEAWVEDMDWSAQELPNRNKEESVVVPEAPAAHHTLLSAPATATDSFSAGLATCPACGSLALHRHTQAEIYWIVDGTGEVEVDGVRHKVHKGMALWIPGNAEHGVFCGPGETLTWFYVFPGDSFGAVVYRFSHEAKL